MKFLCPSCKAKYQIADEKVSGRSVRMKCRKCGFIIPLSDIPPAPLTIPPNASEGGGALAVPKAPPAPVVVTPAAPQAPGLAPARAGSPAPPQAAPPSRPAVPPRRPTLADVKGAPPKAPTAPSATAARPLAPAAPSAAGPSSQVSRAPAQPEAAKPAAAPAPVASAAALNLLSALEEDRLDDDATHILKGGALADAFGALVGAATADGSSPMVGMPADEWFVGINDVPVGPIRLAEIRKRAMLGAITGESMVWRDGLEAWRPLKTFPELLAVLEESVSSVRASPGPFALAAGAPPLSRSDADSFASAGAGGGITGAAVVTDDIALAGVRPRSPIFAWLAVAVALGFGVTIGFVVWSKQKPPETIVKYVEVPAKEAATPAAAAVDQTTTETNAAASAAAKVRSGVARAPGAKATDADKQTGGLTGLKGLSALSPSGPGATGTGPGTAAASGGGQLDAAQTQSTVSRYTGSVKRSCWQPALDARDPSAPTSARVVVTITVGASGSVQNVTTSGDPRGYPGLAGCIAGRVRAWQFPATGGTTTVNVPFVFAAQ